MNGNTFTGAALDIESSTAPTSTGFENANTFSGANDFTGTTFVAPGTCP